jgi:hypothetical protein
MLKRILANGRKTIPSLSWLYTEKQKRKTPLELGGLRGFPYSN